jgi:hypothetical protein
MEFKEYYWNEEYTILVRESKYYYSSLVDGYIPIGYRLDQAGHRLNFAIQNSLYLSIRYID